MYKFAAADLHEFIIYGAARPSYTKVAVEQWIKFIQEQDIEKVCCLLQSDRLNHYEVDCTFTSEKNYSYSRIFTDVMRLN